MTTPEKSPSPGIVHGNPANPDTIRVFIDGSTRSHVTLHTASIGLGTYQPGWRWSLHAGPQLGKASENHIGYIISGHMMVRDPAGHEEEIGPGCAFEIPPGSDARVVGDTPCVALDFIPMNSHSIPSQADSQTCREDFIRG